MKAQGLALPLNRQSALDMKPSQESTQTELINQLLADLSAAMAEKNVYAEKARELE